MNEYDSNRNLRKENDRLNRKNDKMMYKARALRTIVLAEAAVITLGIGIPNVQAFHHQREGAKYIVSQMEDNNIVPKDFKYITNDIAAKVGFSYTNSYGEKEENWNFSDWRGYLVDIVNDALEDGHDKGEIAVTLANAKVPYKFIEDITDYDKAAIKAVEMNAYHEMRLEQQNNKGRN